ncbi:hypothetical protein EDB83DRAFT_244614 [Lactarius deliciosus]|nr:hypothetical protein EDB83DRAFT_244614 [Lactarius deliciosus]
MIQAFPPFLLVCRILLLAHLGSPIKCTRTFQYCVPVPDSANFTSPYGLPQVWRKVIDPRPMLNGNRTVGERTAHACLCHDTAVTANQAALSTSDAPCRYTYNNLKFFLFSNHNPTQTTCPRRGPRKRKF